MARVFYSIVGLISAACFVVLAFSIYLLVPKLEGDFPTTYFLDSLLPAIIGLCIEGLLFVGVLTLLQKAAERSELAQLRSAVKEELEFLLTVVKNRLGESDLSSLRDIDFSSSKRLAETMKQLQEDARDRRTKANQGPYADDDFARIAHSVSDKLHTKAKVHLRRLEPLTSVVARFGAEFLSRWLSVTDQLYSIALQEGFNQHQIESWGKNMPFEYYYDRVVVLLGELDALDIH